MPKFSHTDVCMIQAETTLWNCCSILCEIENSGSWEERIKAARLLLHDIADEMRIYNEQFEVEDDD